LKSEIQTHIETVPLAVNLAQQTRVVVVVQALRVIHVEI
jgi:hypothetical protein